MTSRMTLTTSRCPPAPIAPVTSSSIFRPWQALQEKLSEVPKEGQNPPEGRVGHGVGVMTGRTEPGEGTTSFSSSKDSRGSSLSADRKRKREDSSDKHTKVRRVPRTLPLETREALDRLFTTNRFSFEAEFSKSVQSSSHSALEVPPVRGPHPGPNSCPMPRMPTPHLPPVSGVGLPGVFPAGGLSSSHLLNLGLPFTGFPAVDPVTLSPMVPLLDTQLLVPAAEMERVCARRPRPKRFKCPECDSAFSNKGQLKGHLRIHTGERPFECDHAGCGKRFTRNEELTRHRRIHSGARPFPCPLCDKRFGRKDHLKKHVRTHQRHTLPPPPPAPHFLHQLSHHLPFGLGL
ncbi:uncharacterized protein LOC143036612 [Oratosquilla oratoria]|uniref:uncharacterized protein LOC143036612 n=1 Tax=Oratosquilla oratoria TaxID=337810 RepID=UPI003F768238